MDFWCFLNSRRFHHIICYGIVRHHMCKVCLYGPHIIRAVQEGQVCITVLKTYRQRSSHVIAAVRSLPHQEDSQDNLHVCGQETSEHPDNWAGESFVIGNSLSWKSLYRACFDTRLSSLPANPRAYPMKREKTSPGGGLGVFLLCVGYVRKPRPQLDHGKRCIEHLQVPRPS